MCVLFKINVSLFGLNSFVLHCKYIVDANLVATASREIYIFRK